MTQYISKSALVAEIERRIEKCDIFCIVADNNNAKDAMEEIKREIQHYKSLLDFLDILEVKEINNVWHDTRRTIPEDGSEQIICIKEDGLAVSTSGKIVNGTIKWAYLGDLLNINSFNVEVKEVDFKKEFDNYAKDILACDVQFQPFTHLYNCAKYFYELGLKAQKRE